MRNAMTYHHLAVTDRDGCVANLTPAPAERTPRWAEAVSQKTKADWATLHYRFKLAWLIA